MNKIIILTIFIFISGMHLLAQTPDKMSYQAVVRYSDNSLVVQANVGLQILLRQGGPDGSIIFEETHQAITNINGLASLEIGTGSSARSFGSIDWSQGPYFIETRIDPNGGSNYSVSGTSEILSVPYALQAKTASNFNGTISENQIPDLDHYSDMDINGEEAAFSGWDKDAANDFSGDYGALFNIPQLYTKSQVDSLIIGSSGGEGTIQSLSLNNEELKISGGNSVSFSGWDFNAADDFSGDYNDLNDKPSLFDGNYNALQNLPEIYTRQEVDSLIVESSGGEGTVQSLSLDAEELKISGSNSVSFSGWDIDATDDFSGNYNDLNDKPSLFDGNYNALQNLPEIYTRQEVDSLIVGNSGGEGTVQSLSLEDEELKISGGNSVSFSGWDLDAADDFTGNYNDLNDKPSLFDGNYNALQNLPEIYTRQEVDSLIVGSSGGEGMVQSLSLDAEELKISGGNSVSFSGWDLDASDDFDGKYASLEGSPEVYTKTELDSIKLEILSRLQIYFKKSEVISFNNSRDVKTSDIGNTIECTSSSTLTIPSGMNAMQVGDIINLEAHNGADLSVKAASGVTINYVDGLEAKFDSDPGTVRFGLLRKRGENEYIISGQ